MFVADGHGAFELRPRALILTELCEAAPNVDPVHTYAVDVASLTGDVQCALEASEGFLVPVGVDLHNALDVVCDHRCFRPRISTIHDLDRRRFGLVDVAGLQLEPRQAGHDVGQEGIRIRRFTG